MHALRNSNLFLIEKLSPPIVDAAPVMTGPQPFRKPARNRALKTTLDVDNEIVVPRAQSLY